MKKGGVILSLIGKGHWGKNYISTISNIPNIYLPRKYIRTKNYPDLFKNQSNIDGVIIATPISTHSKIALDLLNRGFTNLLIEKPLTQTLNQARTLQRVAAKRKSLIMVGHIQLYDPFYDYLKRLITRIGKITAIRFRGLQGQKRLDSTVIEDWGPHPLYLFMDILRKKPDEVSACHIKGRPDDNMELLLKFGDINASAYIGWTYPRRERQLQITGKKGSLILDNNSYCEKIFFIGEKGSKERLPFVSLKSPLTFQVLEFVRCIKTGKKPKTPLSQGLETVKLIELLKRSALKGGKSIHL